MQPIYLSSVCPDIPAVCAGEKTGTYGACGSFGGYFGALHPAFVPLASQQAPCAVLYNRQFVYCGGLECCGNCGSPYRGKVVWDWYRDGILSDVFGNI